MVRARVSDNNPRMKHHTAAKRTPIAGPAPRADRERPPSPLAPPLKVVSGAFAALDLAALPVFVAVARDSSFALAARRLGLDRSRVSRIIGALEAALGLVLFVRTTRSVRATPEAIELLERIGPALATIRSALDRAGDRADDAPRGEVVVTASPEVARVLVAPLIPGFRAANPGVQVRLLATDDVLDLARAGVDLALRLGRPGPASGVAKRIATLGAGFFAAPAYLTRRGVPRSRDDLAAHEGLWPAPPKGTTAFVARNDRPPAAAVSGDFSFLAAVARAGGGVALLPTFLADEDVAQGRLVRVLGEAVSERTALYLVTRPERPLPARVAALHRYLVQGLGAGR